MIFQGLLNSIILSLIITNIISIFILLLIFNAYVHILFLKVGVPVSKQSTIQIKILSQYYRKFMNFLIIKYYLLLDPGTFYFLFSVAFSQNKLLFLLIIFIIILINYLLYFEKKQFFVPVKRYFRTAFSLQEISIVTVITAILSKNLYCEAFDNRNQKHYYYHLNQHYFCYFNLYYLWNYYLLILEKSVWKYYPFIGFSIIIIGVVIFMFYLLFEN